MKQQWLLGNGGATGVFVVDVVVVVAALRWRLWKKEALVTAARGAAKYSKLKHTHANTAKLLSFLSFFNDVMQPK